VTEQRPRIMYWMSVLLGAITTIFATNAMAANGVFERMSGASGRKPVPNKISNNRSGKAVLVVKNAVPGTNGRGRVVLANVGSNPIRTVRISQDQVRSGGIGPALQLQVYDTTAKRCLYPRPKITKQKRGAKPRPELTTCAKWMPFNGGRALKSVHVPALKGTSWKRKEKHAIDVRWRLDSASTNTDQGKSASFRLVWRFIA